MTTEPGEPADPIDVSAYGRALAHAVLQVLPAWTQRILETHTQSFDAAQLSNIVCTLTKKVELPLFELLTADIDGQRQSPLALLRTLMEPLTDELRRTGAPAVVRDSYDEAAFPNDVYALGPMAWSDFGEEVGEAGLHWGAAKAMAHRQRHEPVQ